MSGQLKRRSTTYFYNGQKLTLLYHGNEALVSLTRIPPGKWYVETTSICTSADEADEIRHNFTRGKNVVLSRRERRVAYV